MATPPLLAEEIPAQIAPLPGIEQPAEGNWGPLPDSYRFEVTTENPSAADLVNRGFFQLQLFRSPQAARHFHHALQADPECAIAWVGLYFSLLESGMEGTDLRLRALEKAAAHKEGATDYERAWADAITRLNTEGNGGFIRSLLDMRKEWPRERHARAMLCLLLRDGYDENGEPRAGQREALTILQELNASGDENDPVALHLATHLAMPKPGPGEREAAIARALLAAEPPSAYLRQAAALLLFRTGQYAESAEALEAARLFDEKDLAAQGLTAADCPTYLDLIEVQAIAEMEADRAEKALALARTARDLTIDLTRATSPATREFIFQILSLESRLHARLGDWKAARDSLPSPQHPMFADGTHPAALFYEAFSRYLDALILLEEGKTNEARKLVARLEETGAMMLRVTPVAERRGLQPSWQESLNLIDVLLVDLRARIALAAGDRELADIWWESATERASALALRPVPRWPLSIAESRARALAAVGDHAAAAEAFREALEIRPDSPIILEQLAKLKPAEPDQDEKPR